MRLRSLYRVYPSLHPSGVVHWVPEQLNIKAVTGACKLIDGCSLALYSATVSVVSAGICHRNKVNSTAWLYRKAQPKDSIIYITLHYILVTELGCSLVLENVCAVMWEWGREGKLHTVKVFSGFMKRLNLSISVRIFKKLYVSLARIHSHHSTLELAC